MKHAVEIEKQQGAAGRSVQRITRFGGRELEEALSSSGMALCPPTCWMSIRVVRVGCHVARGAEKRNLMVQHKCFGDSQMRARGPGSGRGFNDRLQNRAGTQRDSSPTDSWRLFASSLASSQAATLFEILEFKAFNLLAA